MTLRWRIVRAVLITLTLSCIFTVASRAEAHAAQAVVGMPFKGQWAYNGNSSSTGCSPGSHPSCHPNYYGNWAIDLFEAAGTSVKLDVVSPDGAVTFSLNRNTDTCSSHAPGVAGRGVVLNVFVDGTLVGTIDYEHLDNIPPGPYVNGMTIGTITSEPLHSSCYTARHAHLELKNNPGATHSCFWNYGYVGTPVLAGKALGVLGSSNNGPRQPCSSLPQTQQVKSDYDLDQKTDLAWHQGSTLFTLNGVGNGGFGISGASGGIGTANWSGSGDNDGDGRAEVYWHQGSTIYDLVWNGSTWAIAGQTNGIGTPDMAATGDFDQDGKTDIAWYQGSTMYMLKALGNGTFGIAGAAGGIGLADWAGSGDTNMDNKAELFWHQGSTIFNIIWGGSSWGIAGQTGGIGTPDAAAASKLTP